MMKLKQLAKKKRFWASVATIGAAVASQNLDFEAVAAGLDLFSLFGGN